MHSITVVPVEVTNHMLACLVAEGHLADDASRGIVPLVVLDPPSHDAALQSLAASDDLVAPLGKFEPQYSL